MLTFKQFLKYKRSGTWYGVGVPGTSGTSGISCPSGAPSGHAPTYHLPISPPKQNNDTPIRVGIVSKFVKVFKRKKKKQQKISRRKNR